MRCGILLSAPGIERWAVPVLALLAAEPALAVEAVCFLEGPPAPAAAPGRLFGLLQNWSAATAAPLARAACELPQGAARIVLRHASGVLLPEDAALLRDKALDVLISLDTVPLPAGCSGFARHGVWSVASGEPGRPPANPPYWHEVRDREPVSAVAIAQSLPEGTRLLWQGHTATCPGVRFTENAVEPLAMAGSALLRLLLDLLQPDSHRAAAPLQPPVPDRDAPPGNLSAAAFVARQAARSISLRLRARGRRPLWFVAIRDLGAGTGFRDVPMPPGHGYADPFLLQCQDRHWLFLEDILPDGRGRLACLEIFDDGRFGDPCVILDQPGRHLSYPQVFSHDGAYFMLPETCANGAVELYRAASFPSRWTLERVLCPEIAVVDTTVFHRDGVWYFFTTSAYGGSETFLFWSDRPDGAWRYHPANPICSDIRRARGAGALFYSGGSLWRPAQDCSVAYGYAMVLHRVLRLSPTEYAEEAVETILPVWRPGLLATHTRNAAGRYQAIDGMRYA